MYKFKSNLQFVKWPSRIDLTTCTCIYTEQHANFRSHTEPSHQLKIYFL